MNLAAPASTDRGPGGRFLPGARPGPGRPRREPLSVTARALFDQLRAVTNQFLSRRPDATVEDVLQAVDALVLRAREVRRATKGEPS